ncbi:MAG: CBS domain-containing protein [Ferruginibacter sp.]
MNLVKDMLTRKDRATVSVLPSLSVFDALKVMAENNIGAVVVMENNLFLGLFTERDYSRKVILKGKNSSGTTVSEIMTIDLPHTEPEDSIEHCMKLMTVGNIRYLPVFEKGKLLGIISISDVIKETIVNQQETIDHLNNYINS